jgi:hypothetical protein
MNQVLADISTDAPPSFGLLLDGAPTPGRGATLELTSRLDQSLLARVASAAQRV